MARVDEANAMARIGEKSGPCRHGGEMTPLPFGAQILLAVTLRRHQADQGLGLMRVELIGDEEPDGLWIGLDGLDDVSGKVGFGACRSNTGCHDLPASHVEVGNQTLRAMPLVFEFLALDVTGLDGQGWVQTLQGLDASHFIGTHHMRALQSLRWRCLIDLAHRTDLLGEFSGVVGGWSEPVPLAMRLQRAHLLKIAPRCAAKSARQCHV